MIDFPPRHGKSELVSHFLPVWALEWFPDRRVGLASYAKEFASEWGRKARNTIEENEDQLTIRVDPSSSAAGLWNVAIPERGRLSATGGGMICVGTRGPLTGRGLDLGIVDDPFKDRAEANSPLIRRRVHDWWRSTFYPRLEPDSVAIVIQTRWHEDDLIGFLLKQQKDRERELAEGLREDDFDRWTHLSLPALAIDGEPDALGRSSGEALWPERWPRKLLLAKRAGVGPLEWSALYQGRPQPPGTAMFRREWFRYFRIVSIDGDSVFELQRPDREEPKRISFARCSWFVCADTAMKDGQENDYTAVGVFALTPDGDLLVVEIFRARLPQTTQLPAIYDTAERWPLVSWAGVEDASSGTGLLDAAKIRGRPLRPLKPVGSKADRGMAAVVRYENGTIYHRAGAPWLLDFEDEMIEFPYGGNDDQADVLFYAVREMVALVGIVYA